MDGGAPFDNTRANLQKEENVSWVGSSCGRHGSYIFYKAFRFRVSKETSPAASSYRSLMRNRSRDQDNKRTEGDVPTEDKDKTEADVESAEDITDERIIALGEFFFVQCRPEDPICIGELQLLWHDKNAEQDLASTRLYYLPETTPAGRLSHHGEDELLAVSEKIVTRTIDLSTWIVEPEEWNYGSSLPYIQSDRNRSHSMTSPLHPSSVLRPCVNMSDVEEERKALMPKNNASLERSCNACSLEKPDPCADVSNSNSAILSISKRNRQLQCVNCMKGRGKANVLLLSVSAYCRHKAVMKRLESCEKDWLKEPKSIQLLWSLGVYTSDNMRTRLMFCRDTFDYPQLLEHELICEELAPVFKGRPRKKTKRLNSLFNGRSHAKKTRTLSGGRLGSTTHCDLLTDEIVNEDFTSTRRSSSRRRSKRKSPQKVFCDYRNTLVAPKQAKRTRRALARTPTPVGAFPSEKIKPASKSEPSSPSEDSASFTNLPESSVSLRGGSSRKSRRRLGQRPNALNIAIQNSLLENHKVESPKEASNESKTKSPFKKSNSFESTKSDSSSTECPTNSSTALSPTDFAASNDPYGQQSPSPLDFAAIMSTVDDQNIKDIDFSISEENMYIRGLSEGNLPENKSAFLEVLYQFMQKRNTPIGRIPSLGFKKLDLWAFFKLSQEFGGYEMVTAKRLWKHVYDRMGGNPSCTSAATCTRKHFEKLLLPLELYLRKSLRKKEAETKSEDSSNTSPTKISTNRSPLNGRTFNGDAYFFNGSKVASSSPVSDKTGTIPATKSLEVKSEDQISYKLSSTTTTTTNVTSSELIKQCTMNHSSAIITATASFKNFESFAHGVIKDELLADKQRRDDLIRNCEKETSTKQNEEEPITVKSTESNEVIDLTATGSKTQCSTAHEVSTDIKIQHSSDLLPTNPVSHSLPVVNSKHQSSLFSTRTHCPRNSTVPPPYVPAKSSKAILDTNVLSNKKSTLANGQACQEKLRFNRDEEEPHRFKKYQHETSVVQTAVKKRAYSDVNGLPNGSTSPIGSKRPRPSSLQNTSSPSNRGYDIQNLISMSSDKAAEASRQQSSKTTFSRFPVPDQPSRQLLGRERELKTPPLVSHALQSPIYRHSTANQRHILSHNNALSGNGSTRLHGFDLGSHREKEIGSILAKSSASVTNPYLLDFSNMTTANSFAIQSRKLSLPINPPSRDKFLSSTGIKQEVLSNGHFKETGSVINPHWTVTTNGHRLSKPPVKKEQYSHSSKMVLQRPTDSSGSKSFSIDRLTAESNKRNCLQNSAHLKIAKPESSASSSASSSSKAYFPSPSFLDPRNLPRQLSNATDAARLPRNPSIPRRVEETLFRQKPSSLNAGRGTNGLTRPQAGKTSASSSSNSSRDSSVQAFLNDLPPELRSFIQPLIPSNCTPSMLQRILEQFLKSPTNSLQQSTLPAVGLHPNHGRLSAFNETLLRQSMTEAPSRQYITTHSDQQAEAARQLAFITNSNSIHGGDPAAVASALHMFNAYATQMASLQQLSQYQDSALANTSIANKYAIPPELFNQFSSFGVPPINFRNVGALPQLPQGNVSPEIAASLALSYGKR